MEGIGNEGVREASQGTVSSSSNTTLIERVGSVFRTQRQNFERIETEYQSTVTLLETEFEKQPVTKAYRKAAENLRQRESDLSIKEAVVRERGYQIQEVAVDLTILDKDMLDLRRSASTRHSGPRVDDNDESEFSQKFDKLRGVYNEVAQELATKQTDQKKLEAELADCYGRWNKALQDFKDVQGDYDPIFQDFKARMDEATKRRFSDPRHRACVADQEYKMGRLYALGGGHPMGRVKELRSYQLASDNGHPRAQFRLARALTGAANGRESSSLSEWSPAVRCLYSNNEQWDELALRAYRSASKSGVAKADFDLGTICYNKNEFVNAFGHYARSAAGGYPKAWYWLGKLHFHGKGTDKDVEQALYCYGQAAERGYGRASYDLAIIHHNANRMKEAEAAFLDAVEDGESKAWDPLRKYYSIVPGENGSSQLDVSRRVVTFLARYLMEQPAALLVEGIFRESADGNELRLLDRCFESQLWVDLRQYSVLSVADCLKRKLGAYPLFQTPDDFQSLEMLDEIDRGCLKSVICLVQAVEKQSAVNKMSFRALATTIGARLFPPLDKSNFEHLGDRQIAAERIFQLSV